MQKVFAPAAQHFVPYHFLMSAGNAQKPLQKQLCQLHCLQRISANATQTGWIVPAKCCCLQRMKPGNRPGGNHRKIYRSFWALPAEECCWVKIIFAAP